MKILKNFFIALSISKTLFGLTPSDLVDPCHLLKAQEEIDSAPLLPFDPQGWCANANQLQYLIKKYRPQLIVEVGSWKGVSAFAMSQAAGADARIYCIDHWLGSVEHQAGGTAFHPGLEHLYDTFLSNMKHWNLASTIIPIRGESLVVASKFPFKADMIYIDASHETEAVYADLCAWFPVLATDGTFCGDDWSWPSVRAAVERFSKEKGLAIFAQGNFWSFKEFEPPVQQSSSFSNLPRRRVAGKRR